MDINKDIGHQIRYYRKKMNLTQQDLADRIGVTWEMVSRYERGSSMPLYKIEELSDALNIEPSQLFEHSVKSYEKDSKKDEECKNRIPLFVKKPNGNDFSFENTSFSYIAPDWIVQNHKDPFAIDPEILNVQKIQIHDKGILYIARDREHTENDLILIHHDNDLVINSADAITDDDEYVGKVVAQEIRFE